MRALLRGLTVRAVAALAVFLAALLILASTKGFAEPEIPHGAGAQRSLDAGIGSYRDGALEVAVETFSDALQQGDLSQQQLAQAFYYRGLSYRELGRPGQAISDLSAAIAVKNGLSKAQLKDATRNRAGAYQEAGISGKESVVTTAPNQDAARVPVAIPDHRVALPGTSATAAPREPDEWKTSSIETHLQPQREEDFVAKLQKLFLP
jgi:tetratricopeptide (TPR) repeat protein